MHQILLTITTLWSVPCAQSVEKQLFKRFCSISKFRSHVHMYVATIAGDYNTVKEKNEQKQKKKNIKFNHLHVSFTLVAISQLTTKSSVIGKLLALLWCMSVCKHRVAYILVCLYIGVCMQKRDFRMSIYNIEQNKSNFY